MQDAQAAVREAQKRAAAVPAAVAAAGDDVVEKLYQPMRDVLMWNTVYTHALHVYTPVTRVRMMCVVAAVAAAAVVVIVIVVVVVVV